MWQRVPRRAYKDAGMQSLRQEVAHLSCVPFLAPCAFLCGKREKDALLSAYAQHTFLG